MNWLSKLFRFAKNKEPTTDETISPGVMASRLVENPDGTYTFDFENSDLYSSSISRACIHKIATECSKAVPEPVLTNDKIKHYVSEYPNQYQSVSQFIYQVISILLAENNAYIAPLVDAFDQVTGLWAVSPKDSRIFDNKGQLYFEYKLTDGTVAIIEYERVGHMVRMANRNALIGETNSPFFRSAALYEQNIDRSKKMLDSDKDPIRWIGAVNVPMNPDDTSEIEAALVAMNRIARKTGVMLRDTRFTEFGPFDRNVSVLKPEDVQEMQKNAFLYWGCSEAILTNKYTEDDWNGFYQSAIEPLLLQLGEVLTRVIYTDRQIARGNRIRVDVDRLQYASIKSRIQLAFGVFDRGMATTNDSLKLLNMDLIEGPEGNKRYIRGEYRPTDAPYEGDGKEEKSNGNENRKPEHDGGMESGQNDNKTD